ncbi:MAG TPA: hypothetical protein VK196_20835 [Magnetospirillum sp.]|nr:hypothetical protein [Magnetospirillum sp.]
MPVKVISAAVTAAFFLSAAMVGAQACEPTQLPSPHNRNQSKIDFINGSRYAFQVFWSDFEGNLSPFAVVQPGERANYKTYAGHRWYVEMYTPDGEECFGPIWTDSGDHCVARMLYDGGIGIDSSACSF